MKHCLSSEKYSVKLLVIQPQSDHLQIKKLKHAQGTEIIAHKNDMKTGIYSTLP